MSAARPQDLAWWLEDCAEPRFKLAWTALETLRTLQDTRITTGLMYEALYEQKNAYQSGNAGINNALGAGMLGQDEEIGLLTFNAMQIGFDTLVSKLMQADPQVKFQTSNANFETRQKAEILERVGRAAFDETNYYETKEETDLDMLLFGFGAKEHCIDHVNKKPLIIRRHPLDIFMDVLEGRDAPPITLYHVRPVGKDSLRAEYPELTLEIDAATMGGRADVYTAQGMNPENMCDVVRAWRLPQGDQPGRFLECTSTCELTREGDEVWDDDEFPFVFNNWTKRRRGPYPISAAEQIVFLQRNLNRLVERKHEIIYNHCITRVIVDEHAGIPPSHFKTSGVDDIIQGDFAGGANKPEFWVGNVVPEDLRAAIEQDKQDIANILGITALESVGDKPAGLVTQPGLSEYTNQAGIRHFKTLRENERVTIRDMKMLLKTLRRIKTQYGSVKFLTEAMGEYEEVDFADADLPPSSLKIELAPANMLPIMPAGRLDKIMQLAQTGIFSPKQMARLFQSPDIMAALSDVTSGEKEVEWTIYEMTKKSGKYRAPTEHTDLTLGIEKVNAAYERCRRQGQDGAVLERLERWITEALLLQRKQQSALQAQMMASQAAQANSAPQNSQMATAARSGQSNGPT